MCHFFRFFFFNPQRLFRAGRVTHWSFHLCLVRINDNIYATIPTPFQADKSQLKKDRKRKSRHNSKGYFLNRFSLEMSVWNSYPSPADSLWVLFTRFPFPFVQLNRNWQLIFPGRELWEHCLQFILPGRDWQKTFFFFYEKDIITFSGCPFTWHFWRSSSTHLAMSGSKWRVDLWSCLGRWPTKQENYG